MRTLALALILLAPAAAFATNAATPAPPPAPALHGVVADQTGAIVPGAEVDLVDPSGAVAGSFHSDEEGNFQVVAPHAGQYTLVVSEPGFETVKTPVVIATLKNNAGIVGGALIAHEKRSRDAVDRTGESIA